MPQAQDAPVILIDGSSYIYRAYFATERANLRTVDGFPTGAMMVLANMLQAMVTAYPESTIVVVLDAKGPTFRHQLYPEYKATRRSMPEDLRVQIAPIHELIQALGLPMVSVPGVEADDVIGTLAKNHATAKCPLLLSTGDKDLAQLVTPYVTLVNTMTDECLDDSAVVAKFGVEAGKIADYLALIGDKSDNIPGVPGCGPKTAVKWLTTFGSLQAVMENALSVKGKIGERLVESLGFLPLSYQLATIKTDVKLPFSFADFIKPTPDIATFRALCEKFELKSLLKKWQGEEVASTSRNYVTILDKKALQQLIQKLKKAPCFAFDTETTSLDYMQAQLVGVSFAVGSEAFYIPCGHDYQGAPAQLTRAEVIAQLAPLLTAKKYLKIGQHIKYDWHVLKNHNIELQGMAYDTMLESYIHQATSLRHNMDAMAAFYLHKTTTTFEQVAGKGAKQKTFNQVPLAEASHYACEDADITLQLHEHLWPLLRASKKLTFIFSKIEMPLVKILATMERKGALISPQLLKKQSLDLQTRMSQLQEQAFKEAGSEFNLNSPKQLVHILYEKLKLPILKKTPKGAPSTAEDVLQQLALSYPLPALLLEYRSLAKLKSTYTDKLPQLIHAQTGRIHTSYHQAVTATGRLSSSDPNLQNIPIKSVEGRRIRQAFIAPAGHVLLAADYSQIELRIMAHLSQDEGLLEAFDKGLDIHKTTAAEIFSLPIDQVTSAQRRSAKAINFGLIYGMSAFGLAKALNISQKSAKEYITLYFARYPSVQKYMENTRTLALKQGYVETIFGRKLPLADIHSRNSVVRQAAERTAINAPMQGSAADIIKLAMLKVDQFLQQHKLKSAMILQVHDELVLEVPKREITPVMAGVRACMVEAAELSVPMEVDMRYGKNWEEAH